VKGDPEEPAEGSGESDACMKAGWLRLCYSKVMLGALTLTLQKCEVFSILAARFSRIGKEFSGLLK
jgi:hypothetical protein